MTPASLPSFHMKRGVSILEVLISMLIIMIASIATLSYFASTRGFIAKTGNRRAAIERARQRLDQLMASTLADLPPKNGNCYYCAATPCVAASWTAYACGTTPTSDPVLVGNLAAAMRRETTAQFIDDPSAGTNNEDGTPARDVFEFTAKVWFLSGSTDNDSNRVQMRTLRTPI